MKQLIHCIWALNTVGYSKLLSIYKSLKIGVREGLWCLKDTLHLQVFQVSLKTLLSSPINLDLLSISLQKAKTFFSSSSLSRNPELLSTLPKETKEYNRKYKYLRTMGSMGHFENNGISQKNHNIVILSNLL